MEEESPFIKSEYTLFNNIINQNVFNSFSPSEKIKLLLQKDIFFFGDMWENYKFYCQEDFDKLDFSALEEVDFCINKTYKIGDTSVRLNPLVELEIYEGIQNSIWLCRSTKGFIDEIKFNLTTLTERKEKEKYLRKRIAKIDPFKLKNLMVEFDWNQNKIYLAPELSYELVLENPFFVEDWITGEHYPWGMFIYSRHHNLHNFYSDYQKYLIAEFCLNELQNVESNDEIETGDNDVITEKFTAYEQTYFLVKTGLIKLLRDAGYSEKDIARLISKLINRSFDNVRKDIRTITSERIEGIIREKSKRKIDKLINPLKNLG